MEAFIALNRREEALRAAEVSASIEPGFAAPYAYVIPLIRIGEIELARDVLSRFHQAACSDIEARSDRTYSWIDWLPLVAAAHWQVPVSRFDGI